MQLHGRDSPHRTSSHSAIDPDGLPQRETDFRIKRSPSNRISELVSRFEQPTSHEAVSPITPTIKARSIPRVPPSAASWSRLSTGKIKLSVQRFSTDDAGTAAHSSTSTKQRKTSHKTLEYEEGTLEEMDWSPRLKVQSEAFALPANQNSLVAPSPAARFLHRERQLQQPVDRFAAQKTQTAQPVSVPASVTASSSSRKPHISILRRVAEASAHTIAIDPKSLSGNERFSAQSSPSTKSSTSPADSQFGTISSAALSTADSEATAVELPVSIQPSEGSRLCSSTRLGSITADDFGKSCPDATSFRAMSTLEHHTYPAHEIFARDAAPLRLPNLDLILDTLGDPPRFSAPIPLQSDSRKEDDAHETDWSKVPCSQFGCEEERESWYAWVRGEQPSWWKRLIHRRVERSRSRDDLEGLISSEALPTGSNREQYLRSLIFPPFHRLPRNVTLSDLKSNIRKPPSFIARNALLQIATDGILNIFGSAAGIRLTTIEGLRDLLQMITLLVTSASPSLSVLTVTSPSIPSAVIETSAFRTIFITIPSAISLDFASAFGQAYLFLGIMTVLAFLALYEFYRFTGGWKGAYGQQGQVDIGEGYDRQDLQVQRIKFRDRNGWKITVVFFLTTIYLPLSKLALSALFWERGYWPSELGGSDPRHDRCFTTVPANRDGFNSAIWIVPVALFGLGLLACWFPSRMYRVVQNAKPSVDRWTELGELRRDRKGEYERLLDKDPSPFSFLYREYRREWAAFRSIYMAVKLANCLIVVLISPDNCVFKGFNERRLDIIRQGALFAFMMVFFLLDVYSRPQLDEISNRSDRISRLSYVCIALCGLLVALSVPGSSFFEGSAIVIVNAFSYSFNIYFTLIGTQVCKRVVKRAQRRLDFSIDIFSPRLDLSKHITRRIWQETFSTLFLTAPEYAMNRNNKLVYAQDAYLPPCLLNFQGAVGERHAENLKILREIGLDAYSDGILSERLCKKDPRLAELRQDLQDRIAGPDVYYRSDLQVSPLVTTFFGRLDIAPFPFVAVFRYDQDPSAPLYLTSSESLEDLIRQQDTPEVYSARMVRLALRALEGQIVHAPRIETKSVNLDRGFDFEQQITYAIATVKIARNSSFVWQGYNCSSGFEISLEWRDGVGFDRSGKPRTNLELTLPGSQCGILADFSLTRSLAILLRDNRQLIDQRLPLIEESLHRHRRWFSREAEWKRQTLSYEFLLEIFAETGNGLDQIALRLDEMEKNISVKRLITNHATSFTSLRERMEIVTSSKIRGWWFVVFDDLYRRNTVFHTRPHDFSPHYRSSVCYRPMSRPQLESFLNDRGFATKGRAYFSSGFLNKIYFVLDGIALSSSADSVAIHLASDPTTTIHYSSLAQKIQPDRTFESNNFSKITAGTGDGTDEEDRYIRARRAFLFEQAFEKARPPFAAGTRWEATRHFLVNRARRGVKRWLGWTLNETDDKSRGEEEILLDLRPGRDGWESSKYKH
ncbi:uncharacterized protein JCM15063_004770 [Sporobolomyces koalae]|uniref:uncharacterized protein n=1 Tax=Sporobolomyces koalae TaxID=500713 RepID=UPI0031776577